MKELLYKNSNGKWEVWDRIPNGDPQLEKYEELASKNPSFKIRNVD